MLDDFSKRTETPSPADPPDVFQLKERIDAKLDQPLHWQISTGSVYATCPHCSVILNLAAFRIAEGRTVVKCAKDALVFSHLHQPCDKVAEVRLLGWPDHLIKPAGSAMMRRVKQMQAAPELVAALGQGRFQVIKGGLPEDARVIASGYDATADVFVVTITSESFGFVPAGDLTPILDPPVITRLVEDADALVRCLAIAAIIERADRRAAAVDGPVDSIFNHFGADEMKAVYDLAAQKPMNAASESPASVIGLALEIANEYAGHAADGTITSPWPDRRLSDCIGGLAFLGGATRTSRPHDWDDRLAILAKLDALAAIDLDTGLDEGLTEADVAAVRDWLTGGEDE